MPQFRTPRSRPDHCSSSGFSFEKLVNLLQIIGGTPTLEDGSQKASRVMVSSRHTFIQLKSHLPWTFSPPATQGHRPDEPGHPFQPTATSLRTLLRRQPFPYPRRLHNCQETCPGLLWPAGLPHVVQFDGLRLCPLSPQLLVGNDIPSNVLSLSQPLRNERATNWVHCATKCMSAAAAS
ncbi:hypothetical protein BDP67DRAFT_487853 [Colletotrichum lupini]|nr:hypothetical protein BDP67DRAFT_487853 [Colletotrichum lupini]